jgi:HSP20 family protein
VTIERVLLVLILLLQGAILASMQRGVAGAASAARAETDRVVAIKATGIPPRTPSPGGDAMDRTSLGSGPHSGLIPPGPFALHPADLFDRMDSLIESAITDFQRVGSRFDLDHGWDRLAAVPAMDMRDNTDHYVVLLNLSGVHPADVSVTLEGRLLSVQTPVRDGTDSRPAGVLERRVRLPGPVGEAQLAHAVMTNGLLRICIPKGLWVDPVTGRRRLL